MKVMIDAASSIPAYQQIYYQLRRDIETGDYGFGYKLPSKRILAEEIAMSVVTVEHAYALLCEEGYVESRPRRGYFVIYRESDFMKHPTGLVRRIGSMPERAKVHSIFPFSTLSKTMRRVILDYGETIFDRADNQGCLILRTAISKYLGRTIGVDARPEQIIIGAGAEYLYGLAVQLLGSEETYAVEDPSYRKIRQVYEAHGAHCEPLAMGENGIRTDELQKCSAQILHVTPFNSYPSGITADASKRREYLNWAEERNGYLIEDNYESELTVSKKNEETIFALSGNGRVIYLNTFSRTISSSLRVGYMVLPENLLERFDQRLGFYSCTVSVFEQYVLAELIESGDFERHINKIRRQKRKALQSGKVK